jgi:hypothetical protein
VDDPIVPQTHEATEQKGLYALAPIPLNYDAKNSNRIYQTYWVTFALAIAAFIISAILLFMKLTGKAAN